MLKYIYRKEWIEMKLLVVSDSHLYGNELHRITDLYQNQVDYLIHCGDSSLAIDDPDILKFDVVVKGNHDDAPFPIFQTLHHICITHGHCYQVYEGYEALIQLCQKQDCQICLHGHTHVPTYQQHQGITFINPGSLMMNRGSYGYGTYALLSIDKEVHIEFHQAQTDQLCSSEILTEGLQLLDEFKQLIHHSH